MIKTRKIQFLVNESDSETKKNYYSTIRGWQKLSRNYANDTMNILQSVSFIEGINKRMDEENAASLNDFLEGSRRNLGYKLMRKDYEKKLPSTFRASINSKVFKDFNNNFKEVLTGKKTLNTYREDFPLYFGKKSIKKLCKQEKDFTFYFKGIPMKTCLGRDKSNNESILDKIVSGEYKMSDSSFQIKGTKMFLNLCVKFPENKNKLDDKKSVGVDLGINIPAYCAVNFSEKIRKSVGNKEDFLNQRLKLQKQKRILQKNLASCKGGRGRKAKLKKLEDLRARESNFAKTYNHFLSKQIVEFALENKCATIYIEDLAGIGRDDKNSFVLRNWSYFQLQNFIEYKGKMEGIKVIKIKPKYTSQACSKCGDVHQDNRESQSKFACKSCGFEDNADYNAARNIAFGETFSKKIEEKFGRKKEIA